MRNQISALEGSRGKRTGAGGVGRWLVLAVTVAAQFMVILDVSVVNVALPAIQDDLHFSQEGLQWVITAYAILFGGFLLLGGRLADLLGRRRMFMAGVGLFTLASLLSGLASSEAELILTRALQGLGGALLAPAALSIVVTTFREGHDRNVALAVWGAASGSGGAVGVLLVPLRLARNASGSKSSLISGAPGGPGCPLPSLDSSSCWRVPRKPPFPPRG